MAASAVLDWLHPESGLVSQSVSDPAGDAPWMAIVVWLGSLIPLGVLSFHLGSQIESARRLNLVLWRGVIWAWRLAWTDAEVSEFDEEVARPLQDHVGAAIGWGAVFGLTPLLVFLWYFPTLRDARTVVWIGVASVLMGVTSYSRRRAMAYARDEIGIFDLRLLSLEQYEPAGRGFARTHLVCAVLLPIWWIGIGMLFVW